ncbi:MAG: FxDxF family PEP-CTERM protein [Pseudomonadota bacterium]
MKSTLLALALALVLAGAAAGSAMANDYTVTLLQSPVHPNQWTGSFNLSLPQPMEGNYFSDQYTFEPTLDGNFMANGGVVNFFGSESQHIRFTQVSLNGKALDIADSSFVSGAHLFDTGFSGPLVLTVKGFAGPSASYSGGINITTAVPEPETYGMLLGGLALMGVVARRRRAQ